MSVRLREDIEELKREISSVSGGSGSSIITFDGEKYLFGDKVMVFMSTPNPGSPPTWIPALVNEEDLSQHLEGGMITLLPQ